MVSVVIRCKRLEKKNVELPPHSKIAREFVWWDNIFLISSQNHSNRKEWDCSVCKMREKILLCFNLLGYSELVAVLFMYQDSVFWHSVGSTMKKGESSPRGGGVVSISSVQFSRSVVSDSLRPHESQHTRPPCPSPSPRVHSDSRPSSPWCHPAISSLVVPFSSYPQSLPASESFPMSQWGGVVWGILFELTVKDR